MTTSQRKNHLSLKAVLTPLFVILVIIIGSLYFIQSRLNAGKKGSSSETLSAGKIIPDVMLNRINGENTRLSQIHGKLILMNFWATWCESCMVEMPSLVKLWNKYHSEGLEIVGINLDENPSVVVPRIQKQYKIEFPMLEDPSGNLVELFDIHAIPVTAIMNGQREIITIVSGERDWNSAQIHKKMEQWLSR